MSKECAELHDLANNLQRHKFPFDESVIPPNGIYILYQSGETGHGGDRIVRVGSHTGDNQLCSRLKQHFLTPNKDRSIFRKNIGRALLHRDSDPYLNIWELDLTTRKAKELYADRVDIKYQRAIEERVGEFIKESFSFVVIAVEEKDTRLALESKLISTVSHCKECRPSPAWLGNSSPKVKIKQSGLWLVNELYKTPLGLEEIGKLKGEIV